MTVIPILLAENPDYAGYIIPPAPPRPDFDASREKLQKLGEAESGQLTKVHP
jgi:sorting nexin-5/6/32